MSLATAQTSKRRLSSEDTLALWKEYRRTDDRAAARPPGPDLRPAGQVHRLQEGPRAAGPLRGRGLHLLRPRGADPVDRPLRPGEGRHARAVRVDPHPRRRARRAAPPGLGPALAAPLGARHRARRDQFTDAARPPPDAATSSPTSLAITVAELRKRRDDIALSDVTSLNTLVLSDDETTIERIDTIADDRRAALDPEHAGRQGARPRTSSARAFDRLPQREREVAVLLYVKNLTLREIGEILGVSESRVCQIHAQLKKTLRTRAGRRRAAVPGRRVTPTACTPSCGGPRNGESGQAPHA